MELRSSSQGTYLSLTVVVRLDSRAQLQALYEALSAHPLVRIVL
jgi:putative lipoic acid-binding regulatory protein